MADSSSKVLLKLLINTQTNKVLFAEAGKDCVDFLFHLMSLPIATVIRLLREQGMVGCLGNLYESIENLNETYVQPDVNKDLLLKPAMSSVPLFLLESGGEATGKLAYRCNSCGRYYSDNHRAICPACNRQLCTGNGTGMTYVAPPAATVKTADNEGGFVKGVVTYMVMDDMVIKPMSTISSLTLLSKFDVKEVGALQEKVVSIGMNEAVKLLKTSLYSKKVFTEVFLNN